jgi:hypothetical protein
MCLLNAEKYSIKIAFQIMSVQNLHMNVISTSNRDAEQPG